MAEYGLRILIDTQKGKQFSYMACENQATASISQSLFRGALFSNNAMSASQVYNRITGSISCSYQNRFQFSSSANQFKVDKVFKQNFYLSSSLQGGVETGSIKFINSGVYSDSGNKDTLKRFKFFGEKVCSSLGIAEDLWYFSTEFRLVSGSERHYFKGDVVADSLNVVNNMAISNVGSMTSDLPFRIGKESDRYIKFVKVSASIAPNNDLLIGYNDDLNQYWISASDNTNDPVTFNIGGVNQLDATTINVTNLNTSNETITNIITLGDGDEIRDADGDTSIGFNESNGNNFSNTDDDSVTIRNSRSSPTIVFTPHSTHINPMNLGIDFIVDGDTNDSLLHVSGTNEKIGILTSTPTKELTVSGSISASGDLHISGAISASQNIRLVQNKKLDFKYVSNSNTYINSPATNRLDFTVGGTTNTVLKSDRHIIQHNVGIKTGLSSTPSNELEVNGDISASGDLFIRDSVYLATDGGNEVVGIGTLTPPSNMELTVTGDISASGAIYAKQTHFMHHAYIEDSDHGENFIPMGGTMQEVSSTQFYNKMIAPYDGQIKKVWLNAENTPGQTSVKFYKNGTEVAKQVIAGGSISTDSIVFSNFNTGPSIGTAADRTFSAGDLLQISIDPANAIGEVQVTSVWIYSIGL